MKDTFESLKGMDVGGLDDSDDDVITDYEVVVV